MLRNLIVINSIHIFILAGCGSGGENSDSNSSKPAPIIPVQPSPQAPSGNDTAGTAGGTTTGGTTGSTTSGGTTGGATGSTTGGTTTGGATTGDTTGAPGTGGTPVDPTTPNIVLQGVVGIQSNGKTKIKFAAPLDMDCKSIYPNGSLSAIWKIDPPNAAGVVLTDAHLCEPSVEIHTDPVQFPNAADRFHENMGIKAVGLLPSGTMILQKIEYRAVIYERLAPALVAPTTSYNINSNFKAYTGTPGLADGYMFASANNKSVLVYRVPNLVNNYGLFGSGYSYQKGVYFGWGYMSHPFQVSIPFTPLDGSSAPVKTTADFDYQAACTSAGPAAGDAAPLVQTTSGACQDYCPFDLVIQNGFATFKMKYSGVGVTSLNGIYTTRKTLDPACWNSTKDKATIDLHLKITNSSGASSKIPVARVLVDVDNK